MGIGMSFQRPPTIHGLTTGRLTELCAHGRNLDLPDLARRVHFDRFLDRDVNAGFSGGEIKRSELLQLVAQQPDLILFDEPESGVDLENMALVGNTVRYLLDGMPDQPRHHPAPAAPVPLHQRADHHPHRPHSEIRQRPPGPGHVPRPALL